MNAATRVRALVVKEGLHLVRDPRVLAIVLLLPVVELLLFASAISFDVRDVPTRVLDADRTAASRAYLSAYQAGGFFDVQGEVARLADVDGVFERGEARVVVVIPAGFERDLAAGAKAEVAVLVDGSETTSARMGEAYAIALNQQYNQRVVATWAQRQGLDLTTAGTLEPRVRTWYNPDRKSSIFLIPGLVVVIIMIVTVQQTAVTIVRERDLHTQEQMLISPLRHSELVIGKLLPWTALAFLLMGAVIGLGMWLYGLPLRGSVPLLAVGSALFVFAALALGLIVSSIAPTPESANITALMISFLPAFLLSGFAFPIPTMPEPLQWFSLLFPGRYMVTISRGVFLQGNGFADAWPDLLALAAYAAVVLFVAVRLYGRSTTR